jgi:hypothetical protein
MENVEGNAVSLSSGLLQVEDDMIDVDVDVNVNVNANKEIDPLLDNDPYPSFSDLHSPSLPRKISLKRRPKSSWVWEHFKLQQAYTKNALCLLCSKNVCYGLSRSTGMLECHIQRNHVKVYLEAMIKQVQEKLFMPSNDEITMQSSITK